MKHIKGKHDLLILPYKIARNPVWLKFMNSDSQKVKTRCLKRFQTKTEIYHT